MWYQEGWMSGRKDEGRMGDGMKESQSNNLGLWEFRRGIGQSEFSDSMGSHQNQEIHPTQVHTW